MCQNCQITTHLSKQVPDPSDLKHLDSFDLSFLLMTGYVKPLDPLQSIAIIQKAADVILWGPQAAVMSVAMRKGWAAAGGNTLTSKIIDCFDLTGDITVDNKRLNKILASKTFKNVGKGTWKSCKKKVLAAQQTTISKSSSYFEKTSEKVEKVDSAWLNDYSVASAATMKETIETYPNVNLNRDIKAVQDQASRTLSKRTVDKLALKQRISAIDKLPNNYLSTVSDVEAGRVWNHVGIKYAQEQGFRTYQIISEEDNNVCPVCLRIHGRVFSVTTAMASIDEYVSSGGGVDSAKSLFPFPRVKGLDNRSPEEISSMNLQPPFHPKCRCDVTLLFTSASAPVRIPGPKSKPKGKPMQSIGPKENCIAGPFVVKKPKECSDYVRVADGWRLKGKMITGKEAKRLDDLKLPPSWRNVVVSTNPADKVQAIGMDAAGRWQYRYSAEHIKQAAIKKFDRVKQFSRDMPNIITNMEKGVAANETEAMLLRIENKTAMRVGSDTDFKAKVKAYGLTTLQAEHVTIKGSTITFDFIAKEGIPAHYSIEDKVVAEWLKKRKAATKVGEKLFPDTNAKKLNDYLKSAADGKKYTIKDFRTYHGTRIATEELIKLGGPITSDKQKKEVIKEVSTTVSKFLKNTPTMAKQSYINPMAWEIIGGL